MLVQLGIQERREHINPPMFTDSEAETAQDTQDAHHENEVEAEGEGGRQVDPFEVFSGECDAEFAGGEQEVDETCDEARDSGG